MKTELLCPIMAACFVIIASCKKGISDNESAFQSVQFASDQKIGEIDFNSVSFTNSTMLTNKFFPYQTIGRTYVFEGETPDGLERNEIQRIDVVKVVMGINVAVIRDRVWLDGVLEEDTRDWFAQDNDGNVWYMGEDVDNYNPDGTIRDHEGAWEAGINGAVAGIIMLANPKSGISYQQEFAAGIAEDKAKVVAMGLTILVPLNTYEGCLKTKEWSDLEKGAIDFKFYAPGIGLIKEKKNNTESKLVAIVE
ncbi:hypothetical protein HB364_07130 [Pseudoflavitalea sp. X16]|uniref:hypothetical protein n=1 Tax=Paraflavitalea devenefica TaxID=2716334 RepID=UPI00141F474B|nr:hypothetical protein [Paraflavitalea devenefica]NII24843.1 hypothetical protein [Paraflavitalea devenefica]